MRRNILLFIVKFLFKMLSTIEYTGLENVPETGACIIAVNHMSRIDPPLIYILLKRKDVTGLAADKYKKNVLFRWIIESVKGIWINREDADFRALRGAIDYLNHGGVLGIAPEGTRSTTGALIKAKTGVAYLADKTNVPVIPVAIFGTENAIRQIFKFRRPIIRVQYGKSLHLPPITREHRDELLRRNTDEIMCHIAAMLPPSYRGEYANHLRLKELLATE